MTVQESKGAIRAGEVCENDRIKRTVTVVDRRAGVQIWWKRCVDERSRMALQAAHCRD